MSRIAYVNGRYLPHAAAAVSIDDRGFLFADAVYEVIEVHAGALIDEDAHLARLARSLGELSMDAPLGEAALRRILREVVARNLVRDGMIYLQVGRGAAPRDHVFPDPPVRPSLVVTARAIDPAKTAKKGETGMPRHPRCPTSAGRGSTSSRPRCCPTCSPSRRPRRAAPPRPG